jgi:uncharacterized membrane protein
VTVLAAIRPTGWDFPLFLHVLGAMILVGGLVVAVSMQLLAWRRRNPADVAAFSRGAFWVLLTVALPGWVVMRVGGEWIRSKEGYSGPDDPSWLGFGYFAADLGFVVLLVTVLLAGLGVRRLRRSGGGTSILGRIATPLATILLTLYLVAVWAMTAKPD